MATAAVVTDDVDDAKEEEEAVGAMSTAIDDPNSDVCSITKQSRHECDAKLDFDS